MKRYFQKGITVVMTMSLMLSLVGCSKGGNSENTIQDDNNSTTPTETETDTTDQTAEPTEEGTEETTEDDEALAVLKDENGNVYDLGGMEIIVADWWTSEEQAEPTTAAEEARQEYVQWIQDTYNFKIRQLGIDGWGDHPETFVNFATTGGDENYVFILYTSSLAAPMASGLFYDLSTLDCLDFTDEKWATSTKDLMTSGSSIFGMRPDHEEPRGGVFFNKRLLEEAGIDPESLYDMQADGTWTWEAFEEVCKKLTRDTDNDGVIDTYAMTNFSPSFFSEAVASNNSFFIGRNDDGTYYNNTKSDDFLTAMNWAVDMFKKYEMPAPEGAEWNYPYSSFNNAEAAMLSDQVYQAGNMVDMEDDFGFVAFPKGPKATTYKNVWDDNVTVIPACYDAERAWKIAFAYNLFSNPTPGYDAEDTWKDTYYKTFRDSRAVDETVALLRDPANATVWYNSLISGIATGDIIYDVAAMGSTPAEKVDSIWNQWQAYIDETNNR